MAAGGVLHNMFYYLRDYKDLLYHILILSWEYLNIFNILAGGFGA